MDINTDPIVESIVDDMSHHRIPVIGDKMRSLFDMIELIDVSEPVMWRGNIDYIIHFKVIEVYEPSESSLTFTDVKILYGDLIADDTMGEEIPGYTFVD